MDEEGEWVFFHIGNINVFFIKLKLHLRGLCKVKIVPRQLLAFNIIWTGIFSFLTILVDTFLVECAVKMFMSIHGIKITFLHFEILSFETRL